MTKMPGSRSIPRPIPDDDLEVRVRKKSPWGKMSDKLKSVAEPASRTQKPLERAAKLKEVNLMS